MLEVVCGKFCCCCVVTESFIFARGLIPEREEPFRGGRGGGFDNNGLFLTCCAVVTGTCGDCEKLASKIGSGNGGGGSRGGAVDTLAIGESEKLASNWTGVACTCDGATLGVV